MRDNLRKLGVIIDDVEIMNHKLPKLPEGYNDIVENLQYKLDDDIDMLTTEIIPDKLSAKNDRMNVRSNQNGGK